MANSIPPAAPSNVPNISAPLAGVGLSLLPAIAAPNAPINAPTAPPTTIPATPPKTIRNLRKCKSVPFLEKHQAYCCVIEFGKNDAPNLGLMFLTRPSLKSCNLRKYSIVV